MIARIRGYRGAEYVALHLDERTGDIWVPVRGDRGRSGEITFLAAAALCVRDMQTRIKPLVQAARELHKLCDRRPTPRAQDRPRINHLARQIADGLDSAWANLSRLLDAPRPEDAVDMDAEYESEDEPP